MVFGDRTLLWWGTVFLTVIHNSRSSSLACLTTMFTPFPMFLAPLTPFCSARFRLGVSVSIIINFYSVKPLPFNMGLDLVATFYGFILMIILCTRVDFFCVNIALVLIIGVSNV